MDKQVLSFIQPSRNNLKYLKWSYNSIRKNLGYRHEICWADDFSNDGTWEWMMKTAKKDRNIRVMRNEGPERLGHTILYDKLVKIATNDIVMIFHADMYACPGMDEAVLNNLERGKVVSATRIEPPLHPDGPEKILKDFGIEPEEFKEQELLKFVDEYTGQAYHHSTIGIFAPWAIYKDDFQRIGGHDPLYAPQSKEDSDIFNRFVLAGYDLVQTWMGFVYHMTSRGSRFKDGAVRNPDGQVFMKNRESSEWLQQNERSTRNFIRKWGHFVKHDDYMKPIIPHKYNIGIMVKNCNSNLLWTLEPWCDTIFSDCSEEDRDTYVQNEQPNTLFPLSDKVLYLHTPTFKLVENTNDIIVGVDGNTFTDQDFHNITLLPEIIAQSGAPGEFDLDNLWVMIKKMDKYEKNLINC
jgi:glycosyltransferase involved in cell wall biosynthesis